MIQKVVLSLQSAVLVSTVWSCWKSYDSNTSAKSFPCYIHAFPQANDWRDARHYNCFKVSILVAVSWSALLWNVNYLWQCSLICLYTNAVHWCGYRWLYHVIYWPVYIWLQKFDKSHCTYPILSVFFEDLGFRSICWRQHAPSQILELGLGARNTNSGWYNTLSRSCLDNLNHFLPGYLSRWVLSTWSKLPCHGEDFRISTMVMYCENHIQQTTVLRTTCRWHYTQRNADASPHIEPMVHHCSWRRFEWAATLAWPLRICCLAASQVWCHWRRLVLSVSKQDKEDLQC